MASQTKLSLVHGPTQPALWQKTIGQLVDEQARHYSDKIALVVPWQNARYSFRTLQCRSDAVARAMLATGLKRGDMIGVLAGNRTEYVEVVLGAAAIGCPIVVLNNTYTPSELVSGLQRTSAKALFIATDISSRSLEGHIMSTKKAVRDGDVPQLSQIVVFSSPHGQVPVNQFTAFVKRGSAISQSELSKAKHTVKSSDVVNVQFTSGTTGLPKAAMLTHQNIINNGCYVGERMNLTSRDIVCCPPPLFHCFGLVMGLLNTISHGSSIVFPSDSFNASLTLDAIAQEQCTVLLGVPTMFLTQLEQLPSKSYEIRSLRLALAAGSTVPVSLQERLLEEMGVPIVLIAYGMTETSPVSWLMSADDPQHRRLGGLGKVMPHTSAKVVDGQGHIVPRGTRGEMCISGYSLMQGYLNNDKATSEAIREDDNGTKWMYTGDECLIDEEGYAHITGRIKDMIIRGGENIYPAEIEEQLTRHQGISEASVVGLPNERFGEVVAAFIRHNDGSVRPAGADIMASVGKTLGRQKVPKHIFWVGASGAIEDFPKTGSGKIQKNILRDIGRKLLAAAPPELQRARL